MRQTLEEANLPTALINSHTGCDLSFPTELRCHLELGWAPQDPVLVLPPPQQHQGMKQGGH